MLSDLKYAFRQMVRNPGFSAGVILILAFAIGANSAEFGFTRSVLLKPLPWRDADRLVYVWNTAPGIGWPIAPVSIPDYIDRRTGTDCFADSTLVTVTFCNVATGPSPEQVVGLSVTPSFFTTLGVSPWQGRAFLPNEGLPGREKVTIISYELWQDKLGGRTTALGSNLRMNGESYAIVGIMPKGFQSPASGLSSSGMGEPKIQLWLPYAFTAAQMSDQEHGDWQSVMYARLRSGVTIGEAQDQIDAAQQRREGKKYTAGLVVGYREQNTSGIRPLLLILQAAVAIILLIACANVGNLLLVRATARRRELAIRLALGCGRLRFCRQLMTETGMLVLIGGVVGIGLAHWGLFLFRWLGSAVLPFDQTISIDWTVTGLTLLVSLGIGGCLGLFSLAALWRQDPGEALRGANTRSTTGRPTGLVRGGLIVAEVALALMLLIAAGLALRSFNNLQNVRPGFTSANMLTAQLSLPPAKYKDNASMVSFYAEALQLIRSLPNVKSAGAVSFLPFSGKFTTSDYSVVGEARRRGDPGKNAQFESVDPEYFRVMQIPLLAGRMFSDGDTNLAQPVVIIDDFLARRYFSGRDPVGLKLKVPTDNNGGFKICTIVGVVNEVKTVNLADPIRKETLYFPLAEDPSSAIALVIKTGGDPRALVDSLRSTIQRIDPELPAFDIQTMDQRIAGSLAGHRSPTILLILFGVTALGLATSGLYAVLAYAVSQRTREIGIRIALGAQNRAILTLVISQGLLLTLIGIGLGLGASFGLNRFLRSLLFGVDASDLLTCVSIPVVLVIVAILACYIPARRATKVDPVVALRTE